MTDEFLTVADRYWVLHESVIGSLLVRCYNRDVDPAEALALMLEHSTSEDPADEED